MQKLLSCSLQIFLSIFRAITHRGKSLDCLHLSKFHDHLIKYFLTWTKKGPGQSPYRSWLSGKVIQIQSQLRFILHVAYAYADFILLERVVQYSITGMEQGFHIQFTGKVARQD